MIRQFIQNFQIGIYLREVKHSEHDLAIKQSKLSTWGLFFCIYASVSILFIGLFVKINGPFKMTVFTSVFFSVILQYLLYRITFYRYLFKEEVDISLNEVEKNTLVKRSNWIAVAAVSSILFSFGIVWILYEWKIVGL